jgi:hypothetical protein
MKITSFFILMSLGLFSSVQAKNYTPNDVYAEALLLEKNIKQWKEKEGKTNTWVKFPVESNYQPRHAFLKAIEILEKINRYRVNVIKTGPIPVNYSVGRAITPNEVYNEVHHAREEMLAMLQNIGIFLDETKTKETLTNKTPSDVYAKLKEISFALDESLGLKGVLPSDVYNRSLQMVSLAKFLRDSQNLSPNVPKVKRTKGKLSNHSLASVKTLISKINDIEKNLGMVPVKITRVPKRVINPSDVYYEIGIVIAELQRIQYKLGLERSFRNGKSKTIKTSDDVIYNTVLAQSLLPDFSNKTKLQKYDANLLIKNPNDVYSLTHYILGELYKLCRLKGVRIPSSTPPKVSNLKPQHVFTKGLEALEMIVMMSENKGMGRSATPSYPVKEITPQEVFDLTLRVDEYLNIIFQQSDMASSTWLTSTNIKYFFDKTPSDVYLNMWKITSILKALLSNQGFNTDHLFQKIDYIESNIDLLNNKLVELLVLSGKIPAQKSSYVDKFQHYKNIENTEVLKKTLRIKKLLRKLKNQQDLSSKAQINYAQKNNIETYDIYHEFLQIDASLSEFKILLDIDKRPKKEVRRANKSNSDVYQKLLVIEKKLITLSANFIDFKTRKPE